MQNDGNLFLNAINSCSILSIDLNYKRYIVFFFLFLFTIPSFSYDGEKSGVRGKRYCEIILVKSNKEINIYNSFGLNDCPENIWKKLNVAAIKKETGAIYVRLNGPRYWVIDGFKNTSLLDPAVKQIDGLDVRKAGEMLIGEVDFFLANIPYHERMIKRHTTWVYEAGKPVYELIDSIGHVFVMHSYCTQFSPLTEQSLMNLGKKLKLPPGWQYKVGVLKKTETLEAVNDAAEVIRDDLQNAYQHAPYDFLQ